ncbi:MDR family MFS transporter [Ralstonia solanacearum]|uniref:MDR family MFS transporter n=1 Tax=Ralstonia solanacearum TaxID=305 RepID=UPI0005AD1844|nr:MDR family MFS transporter [Ralstonia solanacearum]AMP69391.1 disulfide bond formation protein DsbA [Ralstonia solanacearum]MBB6586556.1 multidrug efflux MFS transporter [Ralstonia solanacearum]MCL9838500.1 multidrug efflux MFS transporter [Ralstonia solanacearum]MDB0530634.1 multidrug efflux MFS transporter [Ralstonia solanacearum]MDB0535395.1 multidrug efflux MFS transporter [Ralstonia solanacearum]
MTANGPRADAAAWAAVAAGTLGAMMATLDISIVNSALPTIQGEIGATSTEGTWIATAYLVAEIIIIPLAGWLEKLLGLRNLLLATGLFTAFSMLCGVAETLPVMVIGRAGQGFTGGVLIPTAMTIIASRLPRAQQPLGTALFGSTVILGPVFGPVLGGWMTTQLSWHYAFFINLPVCLVLAALLLLGMPHEKPRLALLREADWAGIAGLGLGLGGMTVVLEEGQRLQWFTAPEIRWLAAMSVLGFALLGWGQARARAPVIRLGLLLDRQFGAIAVMAIAGSMALYGTAYVIPQFLVGIAGYDALQSGWIVLLSGLPMIVLMPLMPLMLRRLDVRLAVGCGLVVLALSAYIETGLSPLSTGSSFAASQLMRGVGTVLTMMFLNQAAIRSVPPSQASDASGLYNALRNLGGSIALACVASLQEQRLWLHSRRIEDTLPANAAAVQDYVADQVHLLGSQTAALLSMEQTIQVQALTMAYADLFWLLTMAILLVVPLVVFLRPLPTNAGPVAAH